MSKRFCDTDLWQKEWFQDLSLLEKITFKYILENCDCAGVWNINFKLASFIIGEKINIDILKAINEKKKQFELLDDNNIFVIDFIKFQYGSLSENCKPHKPIIEKLKKYGLYERVLKGYSKGIETLEEKEQEQEKEKEKEIEIEKSKNSKNFYGEFSNVYLSPKNYDKIKTFVLNDATLTELINELSETIASKSDRYKPYDEKFPDAHFTYLKKFWEYRKNNPAKFMTKADTGGTVDIKSIIDKTIAEGNKKYGFK